MTIVGCARRRPVVPVETGTHRRRPARGNDDCGFPPRPEMTPRRGFPPSRTIVGPWIPAVVGMRPSPAVVPVETGTHRRSPAVDSRRRGNDDVGVRRRRPRSRGDGNPSPPAPRRFPKLQHVVRRYGPGVRLPRGSRQIAAASLAAPPSHTSRYMPTDRVGARGAGRYSRGCSHASFPWRLGPIAGGQVGGRFARTKDYGCAKSKRSPQRGHSVVPVETGTRSPAVPCTNAVDSRRRGNDDCGQCAVADNGTVVPVDRNLLLRREPIAADLAPPWIPAVAGMTIVGCARRRPVVPVETGTHRRPPAVDSRRRGNDDVGPWIRRRRLWVRRPRPSFPWRREPIAGPPPWIRAVAGMTIWVRCRRPSFPWRREPIAAGPPPWIPAVAGMTIVGAPVAARRSRAQAGMT